MSKGENEMKKQIKVLVATVIASFAMATAAYAGQFMTMEDEQLEEEVTKYKKDDRSFAKNEWVIHNDTWYYFDEYSSLLMNSITPDNYYVTEDGSWAPSGTLIGTFPFDHQIDMFGNNQYTRDYGISLDVERVDENTLNVIQYRMLSGEKEVIGVSRFEKTPNDYVYHNISQSEYPDKLVFDRDDQVTIFKSFDYGASEPYTELYIYCQ